LYTWRAVPISHRDLADAQLTNTIFDIHRLSRGSYGSPRVWAELRLGDQRLACSRKRVERLMRQAHIRGIYRHKGRGCTVRDPAGAAPTTWSTASSSPRPPTGCG
jgi:putative transposase